MELENGSELRRSVTVRRTWKDFRAGSFPEDSIYGLRWDCVSGGVQEASPQFFLYGYVSCDDMTDGEIAHSCMHGMGPHIIKVCVLKKDNPDIYDELIDGLGPKPKFMPWKRCEAKKKSGEICGCRTRTRDVIGGQVEYRCRRHYTR